MLITGVILVLKKGTVASKVSRWPLLILVPALVWALTAAHIMPMQELLPLSKRSIPVTGQEAYDISYPAWQTLTWSFPQVFGTQNAYIGAKNEPELLLFFGVAGTLLALIGLWHKKTWRHQLGKISIILIISGFVLAGGEYSPIYRYIHSLPTVLASVANPGRAIILIHLGWSILAGLGIDALLSSSLRRRKIIIAGSSLTLLVLIWTIYHQLPENSLAAIANPLIKNYIPLALLFCLPIYLSAFLSNRLSKFWVYPLVGLLAIELFMGSLPVNPTTPGTAWTPAPLVADFLPANQAAPRIYSHTHILPAAKQFDVNLGPEISASNHVRQTLVPAGDTIKGINIWLSWDERSPSPGTIDIEISNPSGEPLVNATMSIDSINEDQPVPFIFSPVSGVNNKELTVTLKSSYQAKQSPLINIYANLEHDYNPTGYASICRQSNCLPIESDDWKYPADLALEPIYDTPPVINDREILLPILGEGLGYKMTRGHMQMQLLAVHEYMYQLGERNDLFAEQLIQQRNLLDRFSVSTILALFPSYRSLQGMPNVELIKQIPSGDEFIQVYSNKQAYPRIHFAKQAVIQPDIESAREALVTKEIPIDSVAIVAPKLPSDLALDKDAQIEIIYDEPTRVTLNTSSTSSQLLVLRDTMFPGWLATIDGQTTAIYNIDSLFKGVLVPADSHTVEFQYKSTVLRRAFIISGLAWISLLSYLLVLLWRRRPAVISRIS